MKPREHAEHATEQLPARLKAARKAAKITQDELVALADFSPVALSKFERGINSPSFANLVAICHALNVSPNYMTGWDQSEYGSQGDGDSNKQQLINQLLFHANSLSEEWLQQLISVAEQAKSET